MNWIQSAAIPYAVGVASGNGVYLVWGAYGDLQISTNCVDWTDLGQTFSFYKITFEHGVFVASGYGGIWVSTDGINWLPVGTSGTDSEVFTSSNALNWLETSSGTTSELVSVAHGENIFVAVANDGTILTSTDGATWFQQPINAPIWPVQITFGKGQFVIAGLYGSGVSSDGIHWSMYPSENVTFNSVGYGNGLFVAGGWDGGVAVSSNGTNWIQTDPSTPRLWDIAYGKGVYVAVGDSFWNGSQWINTVITSRDGTNWTQTSSFPGDGLFGVTYGGGRFVAVGAWGAVFYSEDGFDWNAGSSSTGDWLYDVCYGDGYFMAIGGEGGPYGAPIIISTDGINWSWRSSHADLNFDSVVFGNGRFVTVGTRGGILESRLVPENIDPHIEWHE
jgi:hypothetical protein